MPDGGGGDYEDETPTPTELIPEPSPPPKPEDLPRVVAALEFQADMDRAELRKLRDRVASLEKTTEGIRTDSDRAGRLLRELRRALGRWLTID
jgi:hypothetical protein